jgi:hypothetical protein
MPRPGLKVTEKTKRITASLNILSQLYLSVLQSHGYGGSISEVIKNLVFEYIQTHREEILQGPAGDILRESEARYGKLVSKIGSEDIDEIFQRFEEGDQPDQADDDQGNEE